MYQIRITDADGTNPVILENADNISYNKVINTVNEGVSFDLPTSDYKSSLVDNTKLWELWDTVANKRKNRGPIHSIGDSDGGTLKISGPGRSQFLQDHIQTDLVAFYYPVSRLLDDLRYENIAVSPSTKTYVWDGAPTSKNIFFPNSIPVNLEQYMQYYGLSKQTKDNAIDDNDGYIIPGTEKPSNNYRITDSYWGGTDVVDSLVIDLGDSFKISKVSLTFPWWGGIARRQNRGYTFRLEYSTYTGEIETLNPASWILLYEDTEGRHCTPPISKFIFYFSSDPGFNSIERSAFSPIFLNISPIQTRYFRIIITGVKAWDGSVYDGLEPINRWDRQCNPDSTDDITAPTTSGSYPKMHGKKISDRVLEPQNDCYASIVEFGAYTTILERNEISSLVKQRIKSDNKQISYFHNADSSETITVGAYRKYEPGSFFRRANITYSAAGTSYTKFFDKDCTNCYEAFNFAIIDDFNTLIYRSNNSAESNTSIEIPRYARSITMKGSGTAVVNNIDAWLSKLDPLSWGGSYSYSSTTGDYLSLNFRGESFIWWATVPSTEVGATVLIKIRSKDEITGNWSGWTILEAGFQIPNNISSEVIYEIPYKTILNSDTTYEIYIENLDGNYISTDSFGGWWVGSFVDYNEDSDKFILWSDSWKQIYDNRFSNGSMFKNNVLNSHISFSWQGDRVQIYSAKGRNHGKIHISMDNGNTILPGEYDPVGTNQRIFIPGGDPVSGSYTINLDTGKKGHEIPGVLVFDTALLTGWKFGVGGTPMDTLPWGRYYLRFSNSSDSTYMANPTIEDSDQFVSRCSDCTPATNGTVETVRYIFVDGISFHERANISGSWKIEKNLDVISSISEALETEWDVGELGLTVLPRIGIDTDIILLEGENTVISSNIIKDGSKMATQLISSGADIDGLPLFSVIENRVNKKTMGRTIQQIQDYRSIADYFTLIGTSRAELVRRREPEYRITVSHVGYKYGLDSGDSFIVKKRAQNPIRVRINSLIINQSKSGGISYELECIKWPPIV